MTISRRTRWWIAGIAALIAVYAAGGFWLAPRLAEGAFRTFVSERLGLVPDMASLTFNPFKLSAIASGIGIRERAGAPLVKLARVEMDLSLASLWRRGVVIDRLVIDQPEISAVLRRDGSLNLSALAPPKSSENRATASRDVALPAVWLGEFTVSGGSASFNDQRRAIPLHARFTPINISLRDFSTTPDGDNRYRIAAQSTSGERLDWIGRFAVKPFAAQGDFELAGLSAETIQRYVGELLPFEISRGQLQVQLSYDVALPSSGLVATAKVRALNAANLGIRIRGEQTEDLQLGGLAIRDAHFDLSARRVDLGRVSVQRLVLNAIRDDNGINLVRLLPPSEDAPPSAPAAPEATAAPTRPWTVALPSLALTDSRVQLEDRGPAEPVKIALNALTITARGYDSAKPDQPVSLSLAAALDPGGELLLRGNIVGQPLAATGEVDLSRLDLLAFEPYVAGLARLDVRSGALGAQGRFRYASDPARFEFDGNASIDGLHTADRDRQRDLIKWRSLALRDIRYRSDPGTLSVSTVIADAPYVDLVITPEGRTNIASVLSAGAAPPEAVSVAGPAVPAKRGLAVDITRVNVRNGSANFVDLSIRPNFGTGIQTLSGTITGLSSRPDSRAKVALEGAVDKYAPVKIGGEVNYLAARSFTDLQANFRNMELTALNPYSGKFAGYRIEQGKLSVDLKYRIVDRKLDAKHKILLTQLQLGERVESKDAVSLPLKLAIALLKDRDGNIDLDLPITGDLDDPKFRVGPIVWKMVVNLFTKIVTSPFTLLGSLFGGGEEMKFVEFRPGEAILDAAMLERLAGVRKALASRPQLQVELPIATNRELDRAALVEVAWRRDRDALAPEAKRADRSAWLKLLSARYASATGQKPAVLLEPLAAVDPATGVKPTREELRERSIAALESALRARIVVPDAELNALGQARARAVQDALLESGEIDPLRVFVTAPVEAAADEQGVRLEIALNAT